MYYFSSFFQVKSIKQSRGETFWVLWGCPVGLQGSLSLLEQTKKRAAPSLRLLTAVITTCVIKGSEAASDKHFKKQLTVTSDFPSQGIQGARWRICVETVSSSVANGPWVHLFNSFGMKVPHSVFQSPSLLAIPGDMVWLSSPGTWKLSLASPPPYGRGYGFLNGRKLLSKKLYSFNSVAQATLITCLELGGGGQCFIKSFFSPWGKC